MKRFRYSLFIVTIFSVVTAWAAPLFEEFNVKSIKVNGLERIQTETFLDYLPIKKGDHVDELSLSDALRSLYNLGEFEDIQVGRSAKELIFQVTERPVINEITLTGNKTMPTPELLTALKALGVSSGRVYNEAIFDQVIQDLERQYFAEGRYGVEIIPTVNALSRKRVDITLHFVEGQVAAIKRIDIFGNHSFSDAELLALFDLQSTRWHSFFTKGDRYSKHKLSGDLERLSRFYMDRGFIKYNLENTQITLSDDKKDVFISLTLNEGKKYSFGKIAYTIENNSVPKEPLDEKLERFPLEGKAFSRTSVLQLSDELVDAVAESGYLFATANPVPEFNEETNTIDLTYFITPNQRVFVRRIQIQGNKQTADEVVRRELRQQEGGPASAKNLRLSKNRLERLGFFKEVQIKTERVQNEPSQVDLMVNVEEQPAGSLDLGFGFGQKQGLLLNFGIEQENFLGTGHAVNLGMNQSKYRQYYKVAHTNPFITEYGLSQTLDLFYSKTNTDDLDTSEYRRDEAGGSLSYGFPLSENWFLNAGLGYSHSDLSTRKLIATPITEKTAPQQFAKFYADHGVDLSKNGRLGVDELALSLTLKYDSRDRAIFPSSGQLLIANADFATPLFDLNYYQLGFRHRWYTPLIKTNRYFDGWVLALRSEVTYGAPYGKSNVYPFFENYFAGGMGSVRGFETGSIGPRAVKINTPEMGDPFAELDDPIGGNLRIVGGSELYFPIPFLTENDSVRGSFFVDIGHVLETELDLENELANKLPDFSSIADFRASVGLGVTWFSPFGPLAMSFALPVKYESLDNLQSFQFSFGATF